MHRLQCMRSLKYIMERLLAFSYNALIIFPLALLLWSFVSKDRLQCMRSLKYIMQRLLVYFAYFSISYNLYTSLIEFLELLFCFCFGNLLKVFVL